MLPYVLGEDSTIDEDIASDNQLITARNPDKTKLNHDDLLVETGNAQGEWTLYQVKTDDNGEFFKEYILSGNELDIEKLQPFINGLKELLDNNDKNGVINYIRRGLQEESHPTKQRRRHSLGGRKSKKNRKSARKSKKNRKSKKSRK